MSLDRLSELLSRREVGLVRDLAQTRGVPALLVGGAVRDVLSGNPSPQDLDFAVQGDAAELGRAVANALSADFYVMDAERGTARVLATQGDRQAVSEVQRSASKIRPSPVVMDFAVCRGASWREDLRARDFTINAIGVDLATGAVIDETGGLADLDARVIRATSDHAIADDPVRALRAIRLAFQLDMRIEPGTLEQASAIGANIMQPSAERVRDEFMAMLDLPDATQALRRLDALGLLTHIVPEIEPMRACEQSAPHRFTVLGHTWMVMEALDQLLKDGRTEIGDQRLGLDESHFSLLTSHFSLSARTYRFAVLLHDCAKPMTKSIGEDGRIHFYGHEALGAEMAAARARALRLSGDEVSRVRTIVRNHMRANELARVHNPPTPRALYRFFRDAGDCAPELALFAIADCVGKRGDQTEPADCEASVRITELLLDRYSAWFERSVAPPPLINGKDVIALGVEQGPRIGQILEAVREAQMAGEISTHEEAIAIARQMMTDGATSHES